MHIGDVVDDGSGSDPEAIRNYKLRLDELRAELEKARKDGDEAGVGRLEEAIHALREHIVTETGLGGRVRRAQVKQDRSRKAVRKAIATAITHIGRELPSLERHLRRSIQTGSDCAYQPERQIRWSL